VARAHGVDRERIYVAGLSAGGAMASLLGELFPEIYAAVGVYSGLAASAAKDMSSGLAATRGTVRPPSVPSEVPTIVFHGDRDTVSVPSMACMSSRPRSASNYATPIMRERATSLGRHCRLWQVGRTRGVFEFCAGLNR